MARTVWQELGYCLYINKRIAAYTDTQWDDSLGLLAKLSPAEAAEAIRGDFSVKLVTGIVRKNPSLLTKGAKAFVRTISQRIIAKD